MIRANVLRLQQAGAASAPPSRVSAAAAAASIASSLPLAAGAAQDPADEDDELQQAIQLSMQGSGAPPSALAAAVIAVEVIVVAAALVNQAHSARPPRSLQLRCHVPAPAILPLARLAHTQFIPCLCVAAARRLSAHAHDDARILMLHVGTNGFLQRLIPIQYLKKEPHKL